MADTVILNGQDIGQAQRATSAVFDVVLAEHGTTFDGWVVLNALATGAFPPEGARLVPRLAAALATGPARWRPCSTRPRRPGWSGSSRHPAASPVPSGSS